MTPATKEKLKKAIADALNSRPIAAIKRNNKSNNLGGNRNLQPSLANNLLEDLKKQPNTYLVSEVVRIEAAIDGLYKEYPNLPSKEELTPAALGVIWGSRAYLLALSKKIDNPDLAQKYKNLQYELLDQVKPQGLPGILLNCNALENPELHYLPIQNSTGALKKIQEEMLDQGYRLPILALFKDLKDNKRNLAQTDIDSVLNTAQEHFNTYSGKIQDQTNPFCIAVLTYYKKYKPKSLEPLFNPRNYKTMDDLFRNFTQLRHCLEEERNSLTESQDARKKTQFDNLMLFDLDTIYNYQASFRLFSYYHSNATTELNKIKTDLESKKKLDQGVDEQFRKEVKYYSGEVLQSLQQTAVAGVGSAVGFCYGFSTEFLNKFYENKNISPNIFHQTDSNENVNALEISFEAGWNYQNLVNEDVIWETTDNDTNENIYCDEILKNSKNIPCTLMLNISSEQNAHAMGFARNEHGIWLHDTLYGLVFFDAKKPDFENKFKDFFKNHLETYYADHNIKRTIRNTAVPYLIKDAIGICQIYLDRYKQIANLRSDQWNKAINTVIRGKELINKFIPKKETNKEVLFENVAPLKFHALIESAQEQLNNIATDVYKKGDPSFIKDFAHTLSQLAESAKELNKNGPISTIIPNSEQFSASISRALEGLPPLENVARPLKALPPIKNPSPWVKAIQPAIFCLQKLKQIQHELSPKLRKQKQQVLHQLGKHKKHSLEFFKDIKGKMPNKKNSPQLLESIVELKTIIQEINKSMPHGKSFLLNEDLFEQLQDPAEAKAALDKIKESFGELHARISHTGDLGGIDNNFNRTVAGEIKAQLPHAEHWLHKMDAIINNKEEKATFSSKLKH